MPFSPLHQTTRPKIIWANIIFIICVVLLDKRQCDLPLHRKFSSPRWIILFFIKTIFWRFKNNKNIEISNSESIKKSKMSILPIYVYVIRYIFVVVAFCFIHAFRASISSHAEERAKRTMPSEKTTELRPWECFTTTISYNSTSFHPYKYSTKLHLKPEWEKEDNKNTDWRYSENSKVDYAHELTIIISINKMLYI